MALSALHSESHSSQPDAHYVSDSREADVQYADGKASMMVHAWLVAFRRSCCPCGIIILSAIAVCV